MFVVTYADKQVDFSNFSRPVSMNYGGSRNLSVHVAHLFLISLAAQFVTYKLVLVIAIFITDMLYTILTLIIL